MRAFFMLRKADGENSSVSAGVDSGLGAVLSFAAIALAVASIDGYVSDRHLFVGVPGFLLQVSVGLALVALAASLIVPSARQRLQLSAVVFFALTYALAPVAISRSASLPAFAWLTKLAPAAVAAIAVAVPETVVTVSVGVVLALELGFVYFRADSPVTSVAPSALLVLVSTVALASGVGALRRRARLIDRETAAALSTFGALQLEQALEQERKRTDALVSDSILMTLLAAAAASSPVDHARAMTMAHNAQAVIADPANPCPAALSLVRAAEAVHR